MSFPVTPPKQRDHTKRDIAILLIIIVVLICLFILLVAGGYFVYQHQAETQALGETATSVYMATKIKQGTEAQATQQAQATATAQALIAQATATAQAKLAQIMGYHYFDTFDSNTSNWRASNEENNDFWAGATLVENGQYIWNVTEAKETFVSWADFEPSGPVNDFDVAIKARRAEGLSNEFCYGLIFRKSPDGFDSGAYILSICENGYYKVSYYTTETPWEIIQDWTETNALQEDDWNLIELSARGPNFTIFINQQEVAQFSDDRLQEGLVAIFIDIYEKTPGQIEFDFFALQPR